LMRTNEFKKFTYLDVHKICSDPQPPTQFIDNEGKYIYLRCGENELMVAELATMNVVSSFDRPIRWALNADPQRHPWADDRTLLVLLYENPKSSPVKYRIEAWDPTQNKKTLDVNVPEFQPSDISGTQVFISPRSKYLVIMPPDGKSILSYNLDSGALVQNIKLNTPRPLSKYVDEGMFSNDDTIFFIRHADFVEAYSIESGELIQKISGLQLIKGNTCTTFCPGDKNNFAYFNENKTFVNYYNVSDALSFSTYDLESGQKMSTTSIQLPYILKNGEKVDRKKHAFSIDLVYLPPAHNGNIAVVEAKLHPAGNSLYDSTIYIVDIPTNTILKSYTWQHSAWNLSFLAFKDFVLARQSPTPIYFLWDISTP
jgi:hypothetical protein